MSANPLPFVDLKSQYARLKPEIDRGIQAVLDHGQYVMGPEVIQLEAELAKFTGSKHCVTCASGTDALIIPLMAENIGPGDAVFVPTFTFTATAEVVMLLGAAPVFVDVDRRNFNMDLEDLQRQIEAVKVGGKLRPRAVIAVDLFGLPADYPTLQKICDADGMLLIADAAQSFGGSLGNRKVGSLAPVTGTSFFPAKPLGCYGDGGAIFTDSDEKRFLYDSIRQHGKGVDRYDIDRVGMNGRFDTIQAAVLLAKMTVFADEIDKRQRVAKAYTEKLSDVVTTPDIPIHAISAWAQYSILTDKRATLIDTLKQDGIPTAIYYPRPMHLQPAYRAFGGGEGSLKVSEELCQRIVSLPMHPYLDEPTIDRIASAVRRAVQ